MAQLINIITSVVNVERNPNKRAGAQIFQVFGTKPAATHIDVMVTQVRTHFLRAAITYVKENDGIAPMGLDGHIGQPG